MALRDQMIELLEPTVEAMGYELVEVECSTNPKNGVLRLYIDHLADKSAGIGLEDCEKVSHQVSGVLDVEDPMPGEYSLEVSSPGLDRPLRTPAHFEAVVGSRVKLELDKPENGRWRFKGELKGFADGVLTLDVDGEEVNVEAVALRKARLVPEF